MLSVPGRNTTWYELPVDYDFAWGTSQLLNKWQVKPNHCPRNLSQPPQQCYHPSCKTNYFRRNNILFNWKSKLLRTRASSCSWEQECRTEPLLLSGFKRWLINNEFYGYSIPTLPHIYTPCIWSNHTVQGSLIWSLLHHSSGVIYQTSPHWSAITAMIAQCSQTPACSRSPLNHLTLPSLSCFCWGLESLCCFYPPLL